MKQFSIAEARSNLPTVIKAAEAGTEIEITRRGEPVAVVISINDYRKTHGKAASFSEAYEKWRQEAPDVLVPDNVFENLRDKSPGREVNF